MRGTEWYSGDGPRNWKTGMRSHHGNRDTRRESSGDGTRDRHGPKRWGPSSFPLGETGNFGEWLLRAERHQTQKHNHSIGEAAAGPPIDKDVAKPTICPSPMGMGHDLLCLIAGATHTSLGSSDSVAPFMCLLEFVFVNRTITEQRIKWEEQS